MAVGEQGVGVVDGAGQGAEADGECDFLYRRAMRNGVDGLMVEEQLDALDDQESVQSTEPRAWRRIFFLWRGTRWTTLIPESERNFPGAGGTLRSTGGCSPHVPWERDFPLPLVGVTGGVWPGHKQRKRGGCARVCARMVGWMQRHGA